MAPPKARSKSAKKKRPTTPMDPFDYTPPTVLDMGVKPPQYVRIRICNVSLTHLNFEWPVVPSDITLSLIKDAICKRHGGTTADLVLYKDGVGPHALIMADDSASLKDLGIKGMVAGNPSELPTVTIHYDFQAARNSDPIMATEAMHVASPHGINLKKYLRGVTALPAR